MSKAYVLLAVRLEVGILMLDGNERLGCCQLTLFGTSPG